MQVGGECANAPQKLAAVHADKTGASTSFEMPDKPAHDSGVDLGERRPLLVEPVQQMGRPAQVPTSLAAGIAALLQVFGKGIQQLNARILAQTSNLRRPMKEMFKHCASPLESPWPMGRAVPQVYAQSLQTATHLIKPERKPTMHNHQLHIMVLL